MILVREVNRMKLHSNEQIAFALWQTCPWSSTDPAEWVSFSM